MTPDSVTVFKYAGYDLHWHAGFLALERGDVIQLCEPNEDYVVLRKTWRLHETGRGGELIVHVTPSREGGRVAGERPRTGVRR